jgi:hypothetical protein
MNVDLSEVLKGWPYEPGKVNVRVITGDDGEPRIQVRLDLGLLQMHVEGRPDGQRPHDFGSLLEYFEAQLDEKSGGGEDEAFSLSSEDCRALREEAVQYYHRYVALLVLEDYEGVVRDTTRNLRVLDFCAQHAAAESDRNVMEQFRTYITMIRARAMAGQAIKDNEPKAAIHAIDEGLESLRQHFIENDRPELFDQSGEVQALRGMRDALVPKLPVSQKSELHERLARAIEQENYELAAILRDEIRLLKE